MTTEDKRHVLTDMCHGFKKCGAEDIKKAEWHEDYLMKLEGNNDKD